MAWYRQWFGDEYLDLYSHRDRGEAERHIDFVERQLDEGRTPEGRRDAVLDLACGAGRHTEVLRQRGHRALGIDLSLNLLARRPDLPRVGGDMRRLPFADRTFLWVLNFFTSFGYFESERENFCVLEEVARVLKAGGSFLLDLFNPEPAIAGLKPRETRTVEGREMEIERWYDAATRRLNKRIRICSPGCAPRSFLESVRAYRLDEVRNGLSWAGFELISTFGDFDGREYSRASERLILLARKP